MDNFVKMYEVDTRAALQEVEENAELFGATPLRTSYEGSAHSEVKDILIRGPKITPESSLTELHNTIPCVNYYPTKRFSEIMELCSELMYIEKGTQLGRVIVSKISSDGKVYPHIDEGEAAEFYTRYHIVLKGKGGNLFTSGHETVSMLTGDVWYINNHIEHSVHNMADSDRIHVICDIKIED